MKLNSLTIVIPAYNEEHRLPRTLASVRKARLPVTGKTRIIVVDDGSTDATASIARRHGANVIRFTKNKGKGAAVKAGVLAAKTEWTLFMDADLSTPITMLKRFTQHLDADIIIASRNLPESKLPKRQPGLRRMLGKAFPIIVRMLILPGIKDTQCGFKLMRTKKAQKLFRQMRIDRYTFDVELLYLARQNGMKINEVPVIWRNDARSTVQPIRDGFKMLMEIFHILVTHRKR